MAFRRTSLRIRAPGQNQPSRISHISRRNLIRVPWNDPRGIARAKEGIPLKVLVEQVHAHIGWLSRQTGSVGEPFQA